jgi:HPt (histidine-containing phosphotransfer) domain-containing protein
MQNDLEPERLCSLLLRDNPRLRDIVGQFVLGLPGRIADLRLAAATRDCQQLTILAHRLKGASGSFGFPQICELAADMERSFRNHSLGECAVWLDRLEGLIRAAQAGLVDEAGRVDTPG